MKKPQSSNERYIWSIFMNTPAVEALELLGQAENILIARNVIKPKRERKSKARPGSALGSFDPSPQASPAEIARGVAAIAEPSQEQVENLYAKNTDGKVHL